MKKSIFFAAVLLLTGSMQSIAQPTKIGLQKSQKYNVESSTITSNVAEVMGQTMETNIDTKSTTRYEIIAGGGDSYDLLAAVTKLQVAATTMGQEMNFDSDKKDNTGPLAETLSKSLNKTRSMTIDLKGTITKQEKPEEGTQGMISGIDAENITAPELFIPVLIGRELIAGDVIPDISAIDKEKFKSKDSGTYTVTRIENGIAHLTYSGTQLVNSVMEQMGMEMNSTSTNTVKSTLQVDSKTGLVITRITETSSAVSVDAGGMTIPANGKTTTTIKISPVE